MLFLLLCISDHLYLPLFFHRRVRHNLAKVFSDVAFNIGTGLSQDHKKLTMACFVALLQDVEPEVRAAAVGHFAPMVKYGGEELFASSLQPLLSSLADDVVMEVRSKMALALMDAAEGGTLQDATILQSFSPLLENFLQDEYPEVQLHVLQNLSRISHLLTQMSGVVTSILHMSKAGNWRVRQGVAQLLPHLAEARGMEFFQSVLMEPAWLVLLLDPVASVREACVSGTTKLCEVAGSDWMLHTLVPKHQEIYEQSNYLLRMTILHTYVYMSLSKQDEVIEEGVNCLIKAFSDKVANVRMTAAKGLMQLLRDELVNDKAKVKASLESCMEEETDADVRHFCQLALEAC
jgi:serine/threonine-protein phosphatase 2A regulatory subunit A